MKNSLPECAGAGEMKNGAGPATLRAPGPRPAEAPSLQVRLGDPVPVFSGVPAEDGAYTPPLSPQQRASDEEGNPSTLHSVGESVGLKCPRAEVASPTKEQSL